MALVSTRKALSINTERHDSTLYVHEHLTGELTDSKGQKIRSIAIEDQRQKVQRQSSQKSKNRSTAFFSNGLMTKSIWCITFLAGVVFERIINESLDYYLKSDSITNTDVKALEDQSTYFFTETRSLESGIPNQISKNGSLISEVLQNFATPTLGAFILQDLTTAAAQRPGNWTEWLTCVRKPGNCIRRESDLILHSSLQPGHCWPIEGPSGQIGIALSSPTNITHIAIGHTLQKMKDLGKSAPRTLILWGILEGDNNWRKYDSASSIIQNSIGQMAVPNTFIDVRKGMLDSNRTILLSMAKFEFDLYGEKNVQYFEVDKIVRSLDLTFRFMRLDILNNWGADWTCIYRVGLYGP